MLNFDQINKQVEAESTAGDNRYTAILEKTCTPKVSVWRYLFQPGNPPTLERVVASVSHFYTITKTGESGEEEELRLPERIQMIDSTIPDEELKQLITHIIGHNGIVKAAIDESLTKRQRRDKVKVLQADLASKTLNFAYPYNAEFAYRSPLSLTVGDKVVINAKRLADEWLDHKAESMVKWHRYLKNHPEEAERIRREEEEKRQQKEAEEQAIFDEAMNAARMKIYGN